MSRDAPPPLPGGYKMGEKVFFTGPSQTLSNGDKLVHGGQGEVMGPATGVNSKGKGVDVLYPGNKGGVNCLLTQVRRLRAASAATPPACAPHTRRVAAHAPRGRPRSRDSLSSALAPAPTQVASVAGAAHRPGRGVVATEGRVLVSGGSIAP